MMEKKPTDFVAWDNGLMDLFFDGGGVAIKASRIPPGTDLTKHSHSYDHLSFLSQGVVDVTVDGKTDRFYAPAMILVEANKQHQIRCIGQLPVVWLCIHNIDRAETLYSTNEGG